MEPSTSHVVHKYCASALHPSPCTSEHLSYGCRATATLRRIRSHPAAFVRPVGSTHTSQEWREGGDQIRILLLSLLPLNNSCSGRLSRSTGPGSSCFSSNLKRAMGQGSENLKSSPLYNSRGRKPK